MLPSQQDARPIARRPPSQHSARGRFVELTDLEGHSDPTGSVDSNGVPKAPGPPILPPIPRVASQYGARGPVNLSALERAIMNLRVDEELAKSTPKSGTASPETPATKTPPQTKARLVGAESKGPPPAADNGLPSRPTVQRASSSNFSRPLPKSRKSAAEAGRLSPMEKRNSADGSAPKPPKSPLSASITVESLQEAQEARVSLEPVPSVQTTMPPPPRPAQPTARSLRTNLPPPLRPPPIPPQFTEMQSISERMMSSPEKDSPPPQSARSFSRAFSMFRPSTSDGPVTQTIAKERSPPLPLQQSPRSTTDSTRPQSAKWSSSESNASTRSPSITLGPGKQKQPMFNRFNPISLLSRRKSANPSSLPVPEPFSPPLPADFDPSIRGHVVHDFSAPRGKRRTFGPDDPVSPPAYSEATANPSVRPVNQDPSENQAREHQRTPVFTEHFEDDTDSFRLDESDRRNQDSTGIAKRVPTDLPQEAVSSLPVFAKRISRNALTLMPAAPPPQRPLPPTPQQIHSGGAPSADVSTTSPSAKSIVAPPPISSDPKPALAPSPELVATSSSPEQSPRNESSSKLEREQSGKLSINCSILADGVPSRLKSDASSRFSFDLAGVGSAVQEKILEDKHRQREAQKARESTMSDISIVETDDEDNGFDDLGYEGGFEEDIPGMSDDEDFPLATNVSNFALPPATAVNSFSQGTGALSNSWNLSMPLQVATETGDETWNDQNKVHQLEPTHTAMQSATDSERLRQMESEVARGNFIDDDDLYFDDGEMDSADLAAGEAFDESLLDDENSNVYGVPLRDRPKEPPRQETVNSEISEPSTRPMSLESTAVTANQARATTDTSRTSVQPSEPFPHKSSIAERMQSTNVDDSTSLTQDNLAAYHNALAYAANKAAKEGRFERKESFNEDPVGDTSQPARVSFNVQDTLGNSHSLDEATGSDFDFDEMDDDMDDDAIIAAANAEALENDEDGFYGSEFGFYARAGDGGEATRINGGYFGSNLHQLVKRSHSGRAGGQDPSLTPITERSEWSQRNSMISLAFQQGGGSAFNSALNSTVVSPGLAHLAPDPNTQQHDDDKMSFSALMRLRRSAFGDSNSSLPSSVSSQKSASNFLLSPPPPMQAAGHGMRSSSPNNLAAMRSPDLMPPPQGFVSPQGLTSPQGFMASQALASPQGLIPPQGMASPQGFMSSQGLTGAQGNAAPTPHGFAPQQPLTSPLLHMHTQNMVLSPTQMTGAENTPINPNPALWRGENQASVTSPPLWRPSSAKRGHSRTSTAESITYVKEDDSEGGSRWVMERRRTSEAGEVEVLGRQVLESGRI